MQVSRTEPLNELERDDQLSRSGSFSDFQQGVRNLGHGRYHHRRSARLPRADDFAGPFDGGAVGHRGAAELEDDHGVLTSGTHPSATRSSALRIDAPAAPRTVLCPQATIRTSPMESPLTRPMLTLMPPPRPAS